MSPIIVVAVFIGWARVEKAGSAMEHFSVTERTLTLDEYRGERFEPFREPCFWNVLDEAFLATHEIGHVLVLDLAGELEGPEAERALSHRVRELVEQGERAIAVNLKTLTRIDSTGLGELVRSYVAAATAGGTMALVNAPRHFRELVAAIKLV